MIKQFRRPYFRNVDGRINHLHLLVFFFFFNDTATTEIYTLSLHDALPISGPPDSRPTARRSSARPRGRTSGAGRRRRSEEHTSELQSPCNLVCRLLLEKKKKKTHSQILDNIARQKLKCKSRSVLNTRTVYS